MGINIHCSNTTKKWDSFLKQERDVSICVTQAKTNQLVSMIESLIHKLEKINQGRRMYSHSLHHQIKISCVSNDQPFKLSTSHYKKKIEKE